MVRLGRVGRLRGRGREEDTWKSKREKVKER